MKKKTMRVWFTILFIFGIIIGYTLPGDFKTFTKKVTEKKLQPAVFDVSKKFGQLDIDANYFKYTILAQTETGSLELLRLDDKIPTHEHLKENHFAYVSKGRARVTIGEVTSEAGPGQLIVIPAAVPHSLERVGDTPVEIILFSTPPFVQKNIAFSNTK